MPAELDIPCDAQGRDPEGRLGAFLDEAARPEAIVVGHAPEQAVADVDDDPQQL